MSWIFDLSAIVSIFDLSAIVSITFLQENNEQTRRFAATTFTVSSRSSPDCVAGQHCNPLEQSDDMPVTAPRKGSQVADASGNA